MTGSAESFFHMILNSGRSPAALYSESESERTRVLGTVNRLLADRNMFPAEADMAVMHLLREDEGEIPGIRKYDPFSERYTTKNLTQEGNFHDNDKKQTGNCCCGHR